MGRRLIVCVDGTWKHADYGGQRGAGAHQRVQVLPGFGRCRRRSAGALPYGHRYGRRCGWHILDGAFGLSLEDHIRDEYLWLARHYEEGDEIYLIGFSRGAFTVRCLAACCGGRAC